jgi:hypothetical protein
VTNESETTVPIPDHASLNVALTFTGLTNNEMTAVVNNLPDGSTASLVVRKPGVGGKRFEVAAEGLSAEGAKDLATVLFLHLERVANGDAADSGDGQSEAIRAVGLCSNRANHHLVSECGSCPYIQIRTDGAADQHDLDFRPNAGGDGQ